MKLSSSGQSRRSNRGSNSHCTSHLATGILGWVCEGCLVTRVEYLIDEELLDRLAVLEIDKLSVGLEAVVHVGSAPILARDALKDLSFSLAETEQSLLESLKTGVAPASSVAVDISCTK